MNDYEVVNEFGFCEMYEWAEVPNQEFRLGRFVQFDKDNPGKIRLCCSDENIVGVTSVNSTGTISDNYDKYWKGKYMMNEFGDIYIQNEKLAVGQKVYDQLNEMSFIQTRPWTHFVPVENPQYNKDLEQQYVKRANRNEWARVNIAGKAIVEDNGDCKPGEYCRPYFGKLKIKQGTAVPASEEDKTKYYVLNRISQRTILILNKNMG